MLLELARESTRVDVTTAVVKTQAQPLDLGQNGRALKQLGIQAFQCDHRLIVDLFQEVLGLLAHFVLGAKVRRVDDIRWDVGLVVDVATAAKVFTVVFTIVEGFDFVATDLNATVGTTKILLHLEIIV